MEMARGQELRNGAGHALFLPGSGQAIGSAQHGGKWCRGGRDRQKQEERQ